MIELNTIYNMNLDADYIHLLLSFPPDYSLSRTVNRLKQMTTNYLYRNERTKNWLKQFYWKKNVYYGHLAILFQL